MAFPDEVELFSQRVRAKYPQVEIVYVVLWVSPDELLKRDTRRIKEHQMGERCLELVKEFEASGVDHRFLYDTTQIGPTQIEKIINEVKRNPAFTYL
nr:hypothetical protein [Jeotgalibacillus malaysiensis]